MKSQEAERRWQSFFIRDRGQHVKDFSRTTAEMSRSFLQTFSHPNFLFFSPLCLINIKNFHSCISMEIGKGTKWGRRRRSVEPEKLLQLVVPGGQPTSEPKRTRTHQCWSCNLATCASQEICGGNILVTIFSSLFRSF